jgi:hypothetical protein
MLVVFVLQSLWNPFVVVEVVAVLTEPRNFDEKLSAIWTVAAIWKVASR